MKNDNHPGQYAEIIAFLPVIFVLIAIYFDLSNYLLIVITAIFLIVVISCMNTNTSEKIKIFRNSLIWALVGVAFMWGFIYYNSDVFNTLSFPFGAQSLSELKFDLYVMGGTIFSSIGLRRPLRKNGF